MDKCFVPPFGSPNVPRLLSPHVIRWLLLSVSSLGLGGLIAPPALAATAAQISADTVPSVKTFVPLAQPLEATADQTSTLSQADLAASPAEQAAALEAPPAAAAINLSQEEGTQEEVAQEEPMATEEEEEAIARWSIQTEALFLDRDIPDVVTTRDRQTGDAYGTDELSFDLDTGLRWTLGYQLSAADSLEFTGFGLINHEDGETFTSSILSPGGEVLQAAFRPAVNDPEASNFAQAFRQSIHYSTETSNFELNYRHTLPRSSAGWQSSFLAGLRFVNLDEAFRFTSIDEDPEIFPSTSVGRYAIDANNQGIGLQIGGDLSYRVARNLALGMRLRTGLLLNTGSQDSEIRNDLGGAIVTNDGNDGNTEISPIVELGAFLNWALSRQVSLRAGYTFLLLGNMVLAPNQFAGNSNFDSSLSDLDRSTAIYHGPSIGLEIRF